MTNRTCWITRLPWTATVLSILLSLMVTLSYSCTSDYAHVSASDFIVKDIPTSWSVLGKDEIAKYQAKEENSLASDSTRVPAKVLLFAGLPRHNGNPSPSVVVEVIPLGDFNTVQDVLNYNENIYRTYFKGYHRNTLEYDGDTKALLIYEYLGDNDSPLIVLDAWLVRKSVVWRVGFQSTAQEFDKDVITYADILNSFVIRDGNITFGQITLQK